MTARMITHEAFCSTCDASCYSRNAFAWMANHVKHNPTHEGGVTLSYHVKGKEQCRPQTSV